MSAQSTLLTSSKGVDLHAATAWRVMHDRLEFGDRLRGLLRCELHTFWGQPAGVDIERLLNTGRYFNPNKHHYGHFVLPEAGSPWQQDGRRAARRDERDLPADWPGQAVATDLTATGPGLDDLYDRLLGGRPAAGLQVVDAVACDLGQDGPVLSGVLWRLLLDCAPGEAAELGERLTVARSRKQGLLVNPHMTDWMLRVGGGQEPR